MNKKTFLKWLPLALIILVVFILGYVVFFTNVATPDLNFPFAVYVLLGFMATGLTMLHLIYGLKFMKKLEKHPARFKKMFRASPAKIGLVRRIVGITTHGFIAGGIFYKMLIDYDFKKPDDLWRLRNAALIAFYVLLAFVVLLFLSPVFVRVFF